MRNKIRLLMSIVALCAFSAQAANLFWNGDGVDNSWTTVENWGTTGAFPGDGQVDAALVTSSTSQSTPATIHTSLIFSNSVALKIRNKSFVRAEEGARAEFSAMQIGVNASAGKGSTLTQSGGWISTATLEIGTATSDDYGNQYIISGSSILKTTADMTLGAGSTFRLSGSEAMIQVGDQSGDDLTMSGVGSELEFVLGPSGASEIDVFDTFRIDSVNSLLTIDASSVSTNSATYELVYFSAVEGAFAPENIMITGLEDGLSSSVWYDSDRMTLVISGERTISPEPVGAMMYLPITCTLKPAAGSSTQADDDLLCNGTDLSSSNLTCNRTTAGDAYVYSVTYIQDPEEDALGDTLTFDIRVEGFEGSLYSYSSTSGASSVSALGASVDVTDLNHAWGVGGDDDVGPGQSLRFRVENVHSSSGLITSEGFNSVALKETNGGYSHQHIRGQGAELDSGTFSSSAETFAIQAADANPFVITGAGSNATDKEWAVTSIAFGFKGPLIAWDPTDYSSYKTASYMLDEYAAQTNYANYPDFSWDTVPRWVIVRKASPAYTDAEVTSLAENYDVVVWEKANKAGFTYVEEGILDASSRVKAIKPSVKSLFYRNTSLYYGGYESDATYDQWNWSQHTIDTNGNDVLDLHKDLYPWFNYDIADMRDWWINDAALPMILHDPINGVAPIDGVFCDKCLVPTDSYFFDENGAAYNEYIETQYDLAQALKANDKLMVGNVIRNERHNGGREYMRFYDGSYLERWSMPYSNSGQSTADARCASIQLMREASLKGKMIFLKSGENSAASSAEEMSESMPYFLAIYLIVAEKYSYYAYQDTVNALEDEFHWETSWMPEFSYPLGEPLGGPLKDGYIYARSFEHVDVWVNLATDEAILAWDGLDADGDGLDDQWEFRYFGDLTRADPDGNPDGDPLTNIEEYRAGTNPNLPESLVISDLDMEESLQLKWDAVNGYQYNVYWSSNLVSGFTLVGSNVLEGLYIDLSMRDADQGFYKITVEQVP